MIKRSNNNQQWHRQAVVYHIYPLSFKDSNGDGYGDLRGIIEKLDYLNDGTEKSLGVNVIWLSPVYKSPMADFGYDVSDYYDIDPVFGDLATFDELVSEIHKRGMKLIMDFVPNHTSLEHPWFRESRSSRNNPKRQWYIWKDPKKDGSPPNNWLSSFGGSAWTLDEKTGQYYLHSFLPEQPDLNWRDPEVKAAMLEVMRFWLKRGVDGFRTDAAYHLIKDAEFRDDPPNPQYIQGKDDPYKSLLHIYSAGQVGVLDTTNTLCGALGEHEDKFIVSEVFIDIPEMIKFFRACDNKLHAPLNFNLISLPWDAKIYKKFADDFESSLGPGDWPNYVLSNHDWPRVAERLGKARARLAAFLLLTLRGMPFIYYGDELGMKNVKIPREKIKDPWEKRVPGFGLGRDPERTPMQWDESFFAGFSKVEPWLPVAEDYTEYNVEVERSSPKSFFNLYRSLIHYRLKSEVLKWGAYRPLEVNHLSVFGFIREYEGKRCLILLNFSEEETKITLPFGEGTLVCNSFMDREVPAKMDLSALTLLPLEGFLIEIIG